MLRGGIPIVQELGGDSPRQSGCGFQCRNWVPDFLHVGGAANALYLYNVLAAPQPPAQMHYSCKVTSHTLSSLNSIIKY